MGGAVIRGMLAAGRVQPDDVLVFDPDAQRSAEAGSLGLRVAGSAVALSDASTLLIAVKPQRYGDLAEQLGALQRPTLVISVMAGITMHTMTSNLGRSHRRSHVDGRVQ